MKKKTLPAAMKKFQFPKGQSGNPEGARLQNPAIRALRNLTIEAYREVIELALVGNITGLRDIINDSKRRESKVSAVQAGVATALLRSISRGDPTVLEMFAARIVGKIPEVIDLKGRVAVGVGKIDPIELRKAMKKLEEEF